MPGPARSSRLLGIVIQYPDMLHCCFGIAFLNGAGRIFVHSLHRQFIIAQGLAMLCWSHCSAETENMLLADKASRAGPARQEWARMLQSSPFSSIGRSALP